jgi:hypothetical protein
MHFDRRKQIEAWIARGRLRPNAVLSPPGEAPLLALGLWRDLQRLPRCALGSSSTLSRTTTTEHLSSFFRISLGKDGCVSYIGSSTVSRKAFMDPRSQSLIARIPNLTLDPNINQAYLS